MENNKICHYKRADIMSLIYIADPVSPQHYIQVGCYINFHLQYIQVYIFFIIIEIYIKLNTYKKKRKKDNQK